VNPRGRAPPRAPPPPRAAHSSNGCVLLGSATSARDEPAPRDVIARLVWAFATTDPDQGSGVMRLLCQVTRESRAWAVGHAVTVPDHDRGCAVGEAAGDAVGHRRGAVAVGGKVVGGPFGIAPMVSTGLPPARPDGRRRRLYEAPLSRPVRRLVARSWLSTQEKDTVPAAFFQLPRVISGLSRLPPAAVSRRVRSQRRGPGPRRGQCPAGQ